MSLITPYSDYEDQYAYSKSHGHTNSVLKALEILSKIRGNKAEVVSLSESSYTRKFSVLILCAWKKNCDGYDG